MKNAVVTGVSTGIGRGTASVLAGKGWHVFGSVRKPADAHALQRALGDRFTPLMFDVEDADAIAAAERQVRERLAGRTLDGLVNNAGSSPDPTANVAHAYAALRDNIANGTRTAPGFDHAVRLTRLCDDLLVSSATGTRALAADWSEG